jgi:cellobiose-specific phosphotransferase system component IIA
MENGQAAGLLKKAYDKLKESDAETARMLIEQAMDIDFDN